MRKHKLQQIMADKHRARSTEEKEAMARMMKAIRKKREQAAGVTDSFTPMAQPKNPQKEID